MNNLVGETAVPVLRKPIVRSENQSAFMPRKSHDNERLYYRASPILLSLAFLLSMGGPLDA